MKNKLKYFPKSYCVSLEESSDRHEHLEDQTKLYGINDRFEIIKYKRFSECNDVIHGPLVSTLNSSNKGASTSHLKSIKKWLSTSEESEDYALFFEDDVSFKTIDYWNFTWKDFVDNLPDDWEAVQLMWVRPHMIKIEFRERYPDDWSATAFMVRRSYGKKLLERFMIDDEEFNYDMGSLQPIVENVMFTSGKVYTCPLFVEETDLPTTFINSPEYDPSLVVNGQGSSHHGSQYSVFEWWKNIGCKISVEKIINNHVLPKSFEWGFISTELSQSIKKEFGRDNVYERFYSVEPGDVVVDIGASVGPFTYSILHKKPKVVYCVEPSKQLFSTLVENTSRFSQNVPIVYVNRAISDESSEVRVFSENNPNNYAPNADFKSISFSKFICDNYIKKIDYLKMDCEGGEYDIFNDENIEWILKNVRKISSEFHLTYPGMKEKFRNFRDKYLQLFDNYFIFSSVNQNVKDGYELNLTRWIFDDNFFDSYYGDLMIYIKN